MTFPELFRWKDAPSGYASKQGDPFGVFRIPARDAFGRGLRVIACDGTETGWEHVSVSLEDRECCPSWNEMCAVKRLFWDDTDCVVQFHPPAAQHVNNHQGCLHLWRKVGEPFPMPPTELV